LRLLVQLPARLTAKQAAWELNTQWALEARVGIGHFSPPLRLEYTRFHWLFNIIRLYSFNSFGVRFGGGCVELSTAVFLNVLDNDFSPAFNVLCGTG
jgi:hypothetical protein